MLSERRYATTRDLQIAAESSCARSHTNASSAESNNSQRDSFTSQLGVELGS